jgi:hypothetical protein
MTAIVLGVDVSRVRALIASGALDAEKLAGRWFVDPSSLAERRRAGSAAGRPFAPHNAWGLVLAASGEALPATLDSVARWRVRRALATDGLQRLRGRLVRRADPRRYWALAGELRALRERDDLALSGSSVSGAYELGLVAPDALDAYAPALLIATLERDHALEPAPAAEANVILRVVPDAAWMLRDRRVAPLAAVALDLASYPDPRSGRAGEKLLKRLDRERVSGRAR